MVQMNLTVPQAPERSSPVILSEAKDLAAGRERPFASLRVTRCDCSNGQEPFVHIEPCLTTGVLCRSRCDDRILHAIILLYLGCARCQYTPPVQEWGNPVRGTGIRGRSPLPEREGPCL